MVCAQLANDVAISAAAACNGLKQEYCTFAKHGFPEQKLHHLLGFVLGEITFEKRL